MANVDLRTQWDNSGGGSSAVPRLPSHWQLGVVNDVYTPFSVFIRADVAGAYTWVPASGATAVTMNLAAGEIVGMVKQVTSAAGVFHVAV